MRRAWPAHDEIPTGERGRERFARYLHTVTAAEMLADFIRFPTQQAGADGKAGDERALCEHLAPMLRARGADDVIVGTAPRSEGGEGAWVFARWGTPTRVINAHVDTVPANAGWTTDPWTPRTADGKLYGLGAADTKGGIAVTLELFEQMRPRDVGVLFSGDEEAGSGVMRAFLETPHVADIREVLVCEPTARVAGIAHRGVLSQTATARGPGGHSSKADHLAKPLARLARLAASLDDVATRRIDDGPAGMTGTCLNIADFRGGVAFNVIPALAELEWSIRPYPGFDRAGWDREVATLAHAIDPEIAIEALIDHAPFRCEQLAAFAKPHVRSIGPLDFWTEAALWEAVGVDAIVIGPGDIAQAHAADEFVELAELAWFAGVVRAFVER
jgi:acetylornithine deacetylase